MSFARQLLGTLMLIGVLPSAGHAKVSLQGHEGPLSVRNVNPVVQLYGIPRVLGAQVLSAGVSEMSFNLEVANSFKLQTRQGVQAVLDGETWVASYQMRRGWGERFEWGVEIPLIRHTGGIMDGPIDEFHSLFGFPDGNRSSVPRGRLDYQLVADGLVYADIDSSVSTLGDLRGFLGVQMIKADQHHFMVRGQVKIPAGKVDKLSGSQGTDLSVWGEYQYNVQTRLLDFRLTAAAGVSRLGQGKLMPDQQEKWVGFGHLGVYFPVHARFAVMAQVDAHTDVLDTSNPMVAQGGWLGSIGGRIGLTRKTWLDLAVVEDLYSESASDVVFQIKLGSRY